MKKKKEKTKNSSYSELLEKILRKGNVVWGDK